MSHSRNQVLKYLGDIDITGKTVLDVGAGKKEWWARNFTKGEPRIYKTSDINPEFKCDFQDDLNDFCDHMIGFDVVFCLETLEHIFDPLTALANLNRFTNEGGVCYISTPFINPLHDSHDYLRYTIQFFEKVLPLVGFKDIKITPRVATAKETLQQFYKEEAMRMSKITQEQGYGGNLWDVGYIVSCTK
jgi:SAM-dependent methyltransferase